MSGRVGDLSSSQEKALTEFRLILSDVLLPRHDDHLLLQFLRARRFDLKKSEEMFRRHLIFRIEFDEDNLVNEYQPPEILRKYLLPPLLGYDKDGCPVRIINVGQQDIKGIVSAFRRPEIRRCVTWFLDVDKADMKQRSAESGKWIETRTFIFDLDGLSFRQIYHRDVYELVISFLRLYEGNYPENLKAAFVINTPSFFSWLFNMIKSLISEDTVDKLKIFGHSGWKESLLEHIDPAVLPVHYGGTRRDPDGDPKCPSLIIPGIMIPKVLYLRNQNRLKVEDPGVTRVNVGRRSKHTVTIPVEQAGSSIYWELDCKHCDVDISLIFDGETVYGPSKVTNELVEKECHLAEKPGKYSLVIDNSYSLLRSKTVLYKISVSTRSVEDSDSVITNY